MQSHIRSCTFREIIRVLRIRLLGSSTGEKVAGQLRGSAAFVLALSAVAPLAAIVTDSVLARSLHEQVVVRKRGEEVSKDPLRAALLYCQVGRSRASEARFALDWNLANGRGAPRDGSPAAELMLYTATPGKQHGGRMQTLFAGTNASTSECMRAALNASTRGIDAVHAARGGTEPGRFNPSAGLSTDKQKIIDLVRALAPQYGVEPRLALALIRVESNFDPHARSPMNAQGLMQLIPETARRFNVRNAFDPADNVRGGLTYLRWLLAYYQGRVVLAAAAYNAGEGAVDRYGGVPPFRETQEYVVKITRYFGSEQHLYDGRLVEPSPAFPRRGGSVL